MIDVGVAIFTYNRSEHFRKVLDGFKKNEIHHKVYTLSFSKNAV